jgi:hypothetical protein
MTFLPIVGRELRVAARRGGTFWTRTLVALVAIGIGVFFYLANIEAPSSFISHRIFFGLLVLGILFCLFAGRRFTADCLSEEKRGGTLGLLFLTDLKGYDIVLGKLAATSLSGFYSLFAVFPVLAVPILIGGITHSEFWRAVLVLANTFLFSLAVGIFVSSLSWDARRAMGANLLLMLLIIGIPGACAGLIAYFLSSNFHFEFLCSCPLYSLYLCDDSAYFLRRSHFWWSVALLHVLTWILLWLASLAVRGSWQDRPVESGRSRWKAFWAFLTFGPIAARKGYRKRLLDQNPFYWLASRARFKPHYVWLVLLCIAGWWVGARLAFGALWLGEGSDGTNIATAIMLNIALKLWIGLETCRELAEGRQSGAFELLLSTPITVRDVVQGQWLALKRQFLVPVLVSLAVALAFMLGALDHSPSDHSQIVTIWAGAILMFASDAVALFWTGMYSAVTSSSPNQAAMQTISRIVIAPGVVFAAILALANAYSYLSGMPGPEFWFYLPCWFGLGLTTDLIYGLAGRRQFLTQFRHLAANSGRKPPDNQTTPLTLEVPTKRHSEPPKVAVASSRGVLPMLPELEE